MSQFVKVTKIKRRDIAEQIIDKVSDLDSAIAYFHKLKKDDRNKKALETEDESEKIDKGTI